MDKFKEGLKNCLIERGNMNIDWRLEIIKKEIIKNSDIAEVTYKIYPPKCRKGYLQTVNINIVRNLVFWDTLKSSNDRI